MLKKSKNIYIWTIFSSLFPLVLSLFTNIRYSPRFSRNSMASEHFNKLFSFWKAFQILLLKLGMKGSLNRCIFGWEFSCLICYIFIKLSQIVITYSKSFSRANWKFCLNFLNLFLKFFEFWKWITFKLYISLVWYFLFWPALNQKFCLLIDTWGCHGFFNFLAKLIGLMTKFIGEN